MQPNETFAKRYRLIKRIGTGGYSQVWLAEDTRAGNLQVALKIFAPEKGLDEFGLSVFSKEYSVVFNLNHPALLLPKHFDEWENSPYLILPYCEKGSVYRLIGEMDETTLAGFMLQAATALEYLHSQEPPIIHQDIKPDNFLIDNRGNYLLSDFGISSKIRRTLTKSMGANASAGTLAYMPPEKFSADKQIIKAGDIFALGVTLYELLTGELPFGDHGGLVLKGGADVPNLPSNFSSELNQIIKKCMALEPWDRPTAEQLIEIGKNYQTNGQWLMGEGTPASNPKKSPETRILDPQLIRTKPAETAQNGEQRIETISGVEFEFVFVKGGTFMMGSEDGDDDEKPVHEVTLSDYWIGKYPVTQRQWEGVMGNNPSFFKKEIVLEKGFLGIGRDVRKESQPDHPVEMVSWQDCHQYCEKLTSHAGKTFRLPTEAEWEFAARGGLHSKGFLYSGSNIIDEVGWYEANSRNETHAVGLKMPNELGIFDMSGNVWEWCSDWYGNYLSDAKTNPTGPSSGSSSVDRGGAWLSIARSSRVSNRNDFTPGNHYYSIGFRLALVP